MVSKLPLIFICEIKILFDIIFKNINDKLYELNIPFLIRKIGKNSIIVNREEYSIKEKEKYYQVDICLKLEIKPTSFFISDKNIIVGYILSKILKYFKKRNEIIAKKICKNIFNKIKNYEYMNKHCNIKYCNIYQLENYKKNEIVIPLYAI